MGATLAREEQLNRMYEVADDYEAATLDSLRERAGLTWECRPDPDGSSHWTNEERSRHCERCGRPKPKPAQTGG